MMLISGCATIPKTDLNTASKEVIRGSTIAHTERKFPNLFVYSTGDATAGIIGGAIGGALAGASGDKDINELIQESGTSDPNALFREAILGQLKEYYQVQYLGSEGVVVNEKETAVDLQATTAEASYIVDTSVNIMTVYLPLNWSRYRFFLHFHVTIQDKAGKVLFKDLFIWKTPDDFGNPKMKEFLTNEEIGIAAQIQAALKEAVKYYQAKLR